MTYSQKVIKLMKNNGVSASQLAKVLEIKNPTVVNNWVSRESVPCKYSVQIAEFFEVDLTSLMDEKVKKVISIEV